MSRPAKGRERDRVQYVDTLRAATIALVFLVHVCEVFNPWDEWHITNEPRSRVIGEVAVLAAPWAMPLMMLLAGVSAWYSLSHRDNAAYVHDRTLRLLVPLVFGTLTLVPPQVYLERRLRGQFSGSFIDFYPTFFHGIYPRGNLSWHHLWFLAHLFAYALITLPLFRYWQRGGGRRVLDMAARVSAMPGGVLLLAIPLILERNLLWGLAPERHMLASDWSNHALLLAAFVYGFVLASSPWFGRAIDQQWRLCLVVAVLGTASLVAGTWTGILPGRVPPPYSGRYFGFWMLYAICAWAWMVAVLGVGRRWLDHDGAVNRYARRVGYELYIVHQPVIVGFAYVIVQWQAAVAVKFATLLAVSAIVTVLLAEALGRAPIVRTMLGAPTQRSPVPA